MSLIKNKEGNFYPIEIKGTDWHCDWLWSTHAGNFDGSGCKFGCKYCSRQKYNNRFKISSGSHRLKGEWRTYNGISFLTRGLPETAIFVNPYCDIFTLPKEDIEHILHKIEFTNWDMKVKPQKYIFQTKDPAKYFDYLDLIPEGSWLGTTIETDDLVLYSNWSISKAPNLANRWDSMIKLKNENENFKYFVTIEPIIKQIGNRLTFYMKNLKPDIIFIGANTSKLQLPEPCADDIMQLVMDLSTFTKVYLKSNIKRLIPTYFYNQWKDGLFEKETK